MGHLNPTLPLVRALVDAGHEVHFMCAEMAKGKIEQVARSPKPPRNEMKWMKSM